MFAGAPSGAGFQFSVAGLLGVPSEYKYRPLTIALGERRLAWHHPRVFQERSLWY